MFQLSELLSGLLENRSNVSTLIEHSGIPEAYNRWYSQYKSTRGYHFWFVVKRCWFRILARGTTMIKILVGLFHFCQANC